MKHQSFLTAFLGPLAVMAALLAAVLLSHKGIHAEARPPQLRQLANQTQERRTLQKPEILLLTGHENAGKDTVMDGLKQMKLNWREIPAEAFSQDMLTGIRTVLYLRPDLACVEEEALVSLVSWVEEGGRLALMTSPAPDAGFSILYRKLGIVEYQAGAIGYSSLRFSDGLLPLGDGKVLDQGLNDFTLPVRLEEDCRVYIQTADDAQLPLLWTRELKAGKIAVVNAGFIQGKDARGYVANVLSVLENVLIYPIINAGMIFIDDFPAPQPEGFDQRLMEQYGFDIQGFFRNHWWPDMKRLTWTKNVRYTGVLVETYNDDVTPPFEPDSQEHALIRYYASEILQSGGEIGLHGYNHQPLCLDGFAYAGDNYATWAGEEDMAQAIEELIRYGNAFLPNAQFTCYVPPSNYLSREGKDVMLRTASGLRTISGLYLPETGVNALVQEFREETDGSISVPRITSGFSLDVYNETIMAQELALHGVLSHFIHPDDVLDDERGAALGWKKLYGDFERTLSDVGAVYPMLRWSTASEGAAAVQRYDRVQVRREWDGATLELTLSPFYDEVWLALWCDTPPAALHGAEYYAVSDRLFWLRATQGDVRLMWEAAP